MSYTLVEGKRYLGDIGTTIGMDAMITALEGLPYPLINQFLEEGVTDNPVKLQREIAICLATFEKKLSPEVQEVMMSLRMALQRASRSAQIQE